jgi:hypothetical protein
MGTIIPSGQEIAVLDSTQVAISSNSLHSQYDITKFVSVPTGPSVPSVVDRTNFDHFKRYVKNKWCYDSAILDTAVVGEGIERMAFQVDIWSLMEHRSISQRQRPYNGESAPGKRYKNIFDLTDSDIQTPSTIIKGERTKSYPLKETQTKQKCRFCNTEGKQQCSSCNGRGIIIKNNNTNQCSHCRGRGLINCNQCNSAAYLLVYDEVKVTWHTIHSVDYYQNTFLPTNMIQKMPDKPIFYDGSCEWTNDIFLTSFGELYRVIGDSPVHFEKGIQQQYQDKHFIKLEPSSVIRRLKCLIRYIEIRETDYKLDGHINETERNKGKY